MISRHAENAEEILERKRTFPIDIETKSCSKRVRQRKDAYRAAFSFAISSRSVAFSRQPCLSA
jgi:hypothetical protein